MLMVPDSRLKTVAADCLPPEVARLMSRKAPFQVIPPRELIQRQRRPLDRRRRQAGLPSSSVGAAGNRDNTESIVHRGNGPIVQIAK
jgi:hypothetical protein